MKKTYVDWVIVDELARSSRPGYPGKEPRAEDVEATVVAWQASGIKSVLCLLAENQLGYYTDLPDGLLDTYRSAGLVVGHVPIEDYSSPPVSVSEMTEVLRLYAVLPKPCLVHCSAGIDRTGAVVDRLLGHL